MISLDYVCIVYFKIYQTLFFCDPCLNSESNSLPSYFIFSYYYPIFFTYILNFSWLLFFYLPGRIAALRNIQALCMYVSIISLIEIARHNNNYSNHTNYLHVILTCVRKRNSSFMIYILSELLQ